MNDFKDKLQKHRSSFKRYLSLKGIDVSQNPTWCINPAHDNKNDPAMQIHDDGFNCHSCGTHGDIYDAAGLICGISDIKDQYQEVINTLGAYDPADDPEPVKENKIEIDPQEVKKFVSFITKHPGRKKYVRAFLDQRGYPDHVKEDIGSRMGYWPGYDEARKIFNPEKAGIPQKAWYHSGVVVRLGEGFKLMYYGRDKNSEEIRCQKRNSTAAKTFPCPVEELTGTVILVEAELTALSMRAVGFENVFSTGGVNGITKFNAKKLLNCEKIIFAYDGDDKGRFHSGLIPELEGSKKPAFTKILDAGYKGELYSASLADSKDGDDYVQTGREKELFTVIDEAKPIKVVETVEETRSEEPVKSADKMKDIKPFRFLGYDAKRYYTLPKGQNIPISLNRGETSLKNMVNEIAPEEWWFNAFHMEKENKDGEKTVILDIKEALKWFREESYKRGIFDENRIKGVGAHKDGEDIILNTGRRIKVHGNGSMPFEEWQGENFYIQSKRNFKLSGEKWTLKEGRELWNQIGTFKYEKKIDRIAILGYCAIAPFSSVLRRRPNIWVTGTQGTGKTTLLDLVIIPAVGGENYALRTEGSIATEAFIRQSTSQDSIPIIIDEFDAKEKKALANLANIQNLIRSAYGGGSGGKGGVDNKPTEFKLKNMFCLASVNVRFNFEADRTRIHVVRLLPNEKGNCIPPDNFTGLNARIFDHLKVILEEIETCKKKLLANRIDNRIADTYSPLLVGAWHVVSDKPFYDFSETETIVKFFAQAIEEITQEEKFADEDRVIHRILQQRIRIDPSSELTVAEILTDTSDGMDAHLKILERYGIKKFYQRKISEEVLAICTQSSELSNILKDTPFEDYKEIIQRHAMVIDKSDTVRMANKSERAVIFPWKDFCKNYMQNNEDND